MSQLDTGTESYFEALNKEVPEKLTTPDGEYYYQFTENGFILLHKDHPLMKMTDDEFAASLDDPFYNLMAEVAYATATR